MIAKLHYIIFFFVISTFTLLAQDPNWKFLSKDNTGIGGQGHYVITGDQFDNIWTGGYSSSNDEGTLVRIQTSDLVYTNWSTYGENYLPNGIILDVEFDSTGIIWVGTAQGITTSEDGLNWQHYNTANSTLLADYIEGIAMDANNEPWVVTYDDNTSLAGVGHFNGAVWEYYTNTSASLPAGTRFKDISVAANGDKWIATNNGLVQFDGVTWTVHDTSNSGISSNDVREVLVKNGTEIYALVENSINIYNGTDWSEISNTDWGVTITNANSISVSDDKILLSESGNYGILYYDGANWNQAQTNYLVYDTFIDTEGNYWVSGYGVVGKFDGTEWTRYTQNNTGLPTNFNEDVFIDSQGRRWFANGNGGIQVFDCPNWEVYGPDNEGLFPNPQPLYQTTIGTSITEDADGDIWFTYDGTSGYAINIPNGNYQDYNAWIIFDHTNSHPALQSLQEVAATTNGEVFFRAYNGNVFMYNKNTDAWSLFHYGNGLTTPPYSLTGGPDGKMYIGGYLTIDIYDNGTWTSMDVSAAGIEHIRDIEFDSANNMWVATTTGLYKYDGANWTNWNIDNSNIAANNVTAIAIDDSDIIYISAHNTYTAPYYGGISYFDGNSADFTTFLAAGTPLAHKQVEDIEVDSFGNIWALTQSEGFSLYNPNGIEGFECIDNNLQRILDVDEVSLSESLLNVIVYPNPVENTATFHFDEMSLMPNGLNMYDISGRRVSSINLDTQDFEENSFTIDISGYRQGIYFCELLAGNKTVTLKIIKE